MKKILSVLGNLTAGFFGLLFVILFSPLIIGSIIYFGVPQIYAWAWSRVRHDPKKKIIIKDLTDESWGDAETKEEFVGSFEKLSDRLAEMSGAKQDKLRRNGFEVFDSTTPHYRNWADLSLAQTLDSKHAKILLELDFGAIPSKDKKSLQIMMTDDEDQCGTAFPPVVATVLEPRLHTKRKFTLVSDREAWIVICFLRGDVKFAQPSGQLWALLREHGVWLVQYKADKFEYGLRNEFNNTLAKQYGRDQKIYIPSE